MKFELNKEQMHQVRLWEETHDCKFRTSEFGIENEIYTGAIGGAIEFIFIPTGIGDICKVRCACGATLDVTEYDNW